MSAHTFTCWRTRKRTAGAVNALSQSFAWGFPSMGYCGQLNVYRGYAPSLRQGLPLKPRILLYPVLGERALKGHTSALIDACCIVTDAFRHHWPYRVLGLASELRA